MYSVASIRAFALVLAVASFQVLWTKGYNSWLYWCIYKAFFSCILAIYGKSLCSEKWKDNLTNWSKCLEDTTATYTFMASLWWLSAPIPVIIIPYCLFIFYQPSTSLTQEPTHALLLVNDWNARAAHNWTQAIRTLILGVLPYVEMAITPFFILHTALLNPSPFMLLTYVCFLRSRYIHSPPVTLAYHHIDFLMSSWQGRFLDSSKYSIILRLYLAIRQLCTMVYNLGGIPNSLAFSPLSELHAHSNSALSFWVPFESWFASHDLHLFTQHRMFPLLVVPPTNKPRSPDGNYTYSLSPQLELQNHVKPIHCYARKSDNKDVLIRLITKGQHGREELDILKHVATGHLAFLGENHCLPLLHILTLNDMTFGVFPAVSEGFDSPWYCHLREVFDASIQVLEGLAFLHDHLIAHRDIGAENILINSIGGATIGIHNREFRSSFPIRYYLIDFELSSRWTQDSDPSSRTVLGIPLARYGKNDPESYGRDIAPEMLSNEPYDPFCCDIYQAGKVFYDRFHLLADDHPRFVQILQRMTSQDPAARPRAKDAMDEMLVYSRSLTWAQMDAPVPNPEEQDG